MRTGSRIDAITRFLWIHPRSGTTNLELEGEKIKATELAEEDDKSDTIRFLPTATAFYRSRALHPSRNVRNRISAIHFHPHALSASVERRIQDPEALSSRTQPEYELT